MLNYFNSKTITKGVKSPPTHPYVVTSVNRNLKLVRAYYTTTGRRVASNHPLVNLIKAIGLDASKIPQADFVGSYRTDNSHSGTSIGFTTSYSVGKAHNGVFFNGECFEYILMYVDSNYTLGKDLETVTPPVVVLDHGKTTVGFTPPYGTVRDNDTRACYITVNLTNLMDMYWLFCKAQDEEEIDPGLTVEHFVAMYVIPYMTESFTTMCILNRLLELDKAKYEPIQRYHSFNLPDIHKQLDVDLEQLLSQIRLGRTDSRTFFSSIPSFVNNSKTVMDDLQYPGGLPPTSVTTSWFLTASRMRLVDAMIKLDCRDSGGIYTSMINDYVKTRSEVSMRTCMKQLDVADQRSYRGTLCAAAGVKMFD